MKIRNDFVTNSSSSSFILTIRLDLTNGDAVEFEGMGGSFEMGRIDYFDEDAIVTVSPKQLGTAKSVDELIELLVDGVTDGWGETRIFIETDDSDSFINNSSFDDEDEEDFDEDYREEDAYDFIREIKEKVKSMDDIEKITITGNESNYMCYNRTYTYNLKTEEYTGEEEGEAFEKDGSTGGDLRFGDLHSCKITRIDEDEDEY